MPLVEVKATVDPVAEAVRKFVRDGARVELNAFRRTVGRARTLAAKAFASRGIGRTLAARRSKTPSRVKTGRVRPTADGYEATLQASGLAALSELGGRTRSHSIEAKSANAVTARAKCPLLRAKRISPHVLRHYLSSLTMSGDVG